MEYCSRGFEKSLKRWLKEERASDIFSDVLHALTTTVRLFLTA